MKEINISCESQTSTAIFLAMEPIDSSAAVLSRSPAIDRCNPIIRDSTRALKSEKSYEKKDELNEESPNKNYDSPVDAVTLYDEKIEKSEEIILMESVSVSNSSSVFSLWSCSKPVDIKSPPGSTRYLLDSSNEFADSEPPQKLPQKTFDESPKRTNDESRPSPEEVVVVLRVSRLCKCKGCDKKMRKHISRMEGVTSFEIDFSMKMVTVAGNVKPLEVLSSISKVRNAQLWPQIEELSVPSQYIVNSSSYCS